MIVDLKRINLTVQNISYFFIIKFIIIAKIEYQPLLFRQPQYRFLKFDGQFILIIHIIGRP